MKPKQNLNKLSLNKSTVSRLDYLMQAKIRAGEDGDVTVADITIWFNTRECSGMNLCMTVFKHYCVTENSLSCLAACETTLQCDGLGPINPDQVVPVGDVRRF